MEHPAATMRRAVRNRTKTIVAQTKRAAKTTQAAATMIRADAAEAVAEPVTANPAAKIRGEKSCCRISRNIPACLLRNRRNRHR